MCLYYKSAGDELIVIDVHVEDLLVTATTTVGMIVLYCYISLSIKNLEPVSKFLNFELMRLIHAHLLWIRRRRLVSFFGRTDWLRRTQPIHRSAQIAVMNPVETAFCLKSIKILEVNNHVILVIRLKLCCVSRGVLTRTSRLRCTRQCARLMNRGKDDDVIALESYSDADFAADKDDRESLAGAMVLLKIMPVSLSS